MQYYIVTNRTVTNNNIIIIMQSGVFKVLWIKVGTCIISGVMIHTL